MKLKILLIVSVLILIGCEGRKMPSKTCDYCKGRIYYHIVSENAQGSGAYQFESRDGKNTRYHVWCTKIMELENKVKQLEEEI